MRYGNSSDRTRRWHAPVNAALDASCSGRDITTQYVDFRWIGKLERGEHRWPSEARRAALRQVLGATCDAELEYRIA